MANQTKKSIYEVDIQEIQKRLVSQLDQEAGQYRVSESCIGKIGFMCSGDPNTGLVQLLNTVGIRKPGMSGFRLAFGFQIEIQMKQSLMHVKEVDIGDFSGGKCVLFCALQFGGI